MSPWHAGHPYAASSSPMREVEQRLAAFGRLGILVDDADDAELRLANELYRAEELPAWWVIATTHEQGVAVLQAANAVQVDGRPRVALVLDRYLRTDNGRTVDWQGRNRDPLSEEVEALWGRFDVTRIGITSRYEPARDDFWLRFDEVCFDRLEKHGPFLRFGPPRDRAQTWPGYDRLRDALKARDQRVVLLTGAGMSLRAQRWPTRATPESAERVDAPGSAGVANTSDLLLTILKLYRSLATERAKAWPDGGKRWLERADHAPRAAPKRTVGTRVIPLKHGGPQSVARALRKLRRAARPPTAAPSQTNLLDLARAGAPAPHGGFNAVLEAFNVEIRDRDDFDGSGERVTADLRDCMEGAVRVAMAPFDHGFPQQHWLAAALPFDLIATTNWDGFHERGATAVAEFRSGTDCKGALRGLDLGAADNPIAPQRGLAGRYFRLYGAASQGRPLGIGRAEFRHAAAHLYDRVGAATLGATRVVIVLVGQSLDDGALLQVFKSFNKSLEHLHVVVIDPYPEKVVSRLREYPDLRVDQIAVIPARGRDVLHDLYVDLASA